VYFDQGSVTFAEIANRRMKLGEYLVSQGLVARAHLERAGDPGRPPAPRRRACRDRCHRRGPLRRAIEEQIKEVMYELVRWKTGRFRFTNARRPKAQDIFIDIPLDHLILKV
jgi:hypothetical protein